MHTNSANTSMQKAWKHEQARKNEQADSQRSPPQFLRQYHTWSRVHHKCTNTLHSRFSQQSFQDSRSTTTTYQNLMPKTVCLLFLTVTRQPSNSSQPHRNKKGSVLLLLETKMYCYWCTCVLYSNVQIYNIILLKLVDKHQHQFSHSSYTNTNFHRTIH